MIPRQRLLALGAFAVVLVGTLLLQPALFSARAQPVSYSEFKALVGKGKLSDLVLDQQTIGGSVAVEGLEGLLPKDTVEALKRAAGATHRFVTVRVDDPRAGDGARARTPGFVGADLANLVNEAALHAARTGKDAVGLIDFDEAIDRVVGGLERRSRVINPKEKEIVAYHEAGHALVAESRPHADRVAKISVIPRGVATLGTRSSNRPKTGTS